MKKSMWVAGLFGIATVLAMSVQVYAQSSPLSGKWFVLPDGKSAITLLTLSQSGDSITGKWAPPKGEASEIENGRVAGDTLTFSFVQDKKHFDATVHISGGSMSFDLIGPKKWGKPEIIHGQAARGDS